MEISLFLINPNDASLKDCVILLDLDFCFNFVMLRSSSTMVSYSLTRPYVMFSILFFLMFDIFV